MFSKLYLWKYQWAIQWQYFSSVHKCWNTVLQCSVHLSSNSTEPFKSFPCISAHHPISTTFDCIFFLCVFVYLPLSNRTGFDDSDQFSALRRACNSHHNGVCLAYIYIYFYIYICGLCTVYIYSSISKCVTRMLACTLNTLHAVNIYNVLFFFFFLYCMSPLLSFWAEIQKVLKKYHFCIRLRSVQVRECRLVDVSSSSNQVAKFIYLHKQVSSAWAQSITLIFVIAVPRKYSGTSCGGYHVGTSLWSLKD